MELTREEFLTSAQTIEDFDSLNFSKHCLDWWDNYYSWTKFPPLALKEDDEHLCYLFYHISKDNEYLTIHNLLTPKLFRYKGYAQILLEHIFKTVAKQPVRRFRMYCVSSSLGFYNKLGLEYWGINDSGQYYCDYKMPEQSIDEIPKIVQEASLDELSDESILEIYKKLKNNGTQLEEKRSDIFKNSLDEFSDKYHFDLLSKKVDEINK